MIGKTHHVHESAQATHSIKTSTNITSEKWGQ